MLVLFGLFVASVAAAVVQTNGTTACANLQSSLGGKKVVTSRLNSNYISSRHDYWNARLSRYAPACVVYAQSAQDVSTALQAIRASGSRFAVKAGGHNPNDMFSSVDQGVLIDLGTMTAKSYDANTTLATYEPGSNWGQLYKFYEQYGRTVMGGRLSGVGTGLALGGGLSHLAPQYGMACDSFVELEVVLPSGDVITASLTSNPDLFFGLRGGGGNAFGIVTSYTVRTYPVGKFYAGTLIYVLDHGLRVLDAVAEFTRYNTDPRANILATYNALATPDLLLGLDELIVLFVVYDGPDPGNVFDNFTAIPRLVDTTLGPAKTYTEVAELPIPYTAELSRGDNTFRMGAHRIDGEAYRRVYTEYRAWALANKGRYTLTTLNFYPVPRSLTDASRASANGEGNAMEMPHGPWLWTNYILATVPGMLNKTYTAVQADFAAMVARTPSAPGLPMFLNEAARDQRPLTTFGAYERLKDIKRRYDPDGFFTTKTGGWSFD